MVVHRAVADRGLLVPAFVGCLLATTLIASGPILSSAIATAGAREALRSAEPTAANLRVTAALHDAPLAELDNSARRAVTRATSPVGAVVEHQLRSGSFPTLSGRTAAGGVVMDLGTLAALSFAQERRSVEPTSWLLDTDGDASAVAQQLTAPPLASEEVLDRAALGAQLRSDPVALGVIGALSLGFAAAAALAALGFVVAGIAAVRERITEFALLRAVGLSARQLVSWLTLEHGVLLAGAPAGGILLGGAMSWLVLPYTALDATGASRAVVTVEIAWTDVIGLVAFLLGAVGVSVLLLARPLRRLRLGAALRAGEER